MRIKLLFLYFLVSIGTYAQDTTFSIHRVPVQDVARETIVTSNDLAGDDNLTASAAASSSEIGETPGELSVSLTGGATYSIPIKVPPGIDGIQPEITLAYNSQGGNGLAGYGWNLSGISVITRVAPTPYHDDEIKGVTLEDTDRFALDGQRLLLKSGTYGQAGAVYQTENFSNILIESSGSSYNGPASFKVTYPDGSVAIYGNTSNSRSRMDYAISYWENPQGIRVSYEYTSANNSLSISKIKYGSKGAAAAPNEIQFEYGTRSRPEQSYVGGIRFVRRNILKKIKVIGSGQGYRNYELEHNSNNLGYQRLSRVTEKNGANSRSFTPITFNYSSTSSSVNKLSVTAALGIRNLEQRNATVTSFDLDGKGIMDFAIRPKTGSQRNTFFLFKDAMDQDGFNYIPYEVGIGNIEELFPATWLTHNEKLLGGQGLVAVQHSGPSNVTFRVLGYTPSTILSQQYVKTWSAPTVINEIDCDNSSLPVRIPRDYISGDFNGDGLTDVLAVSKSYTKRTCFPVLLPPGQPCGIWPIDPILNNIQNNEPQDGPITREESENKDSTQQTNCCHCDNNIVYRSEVHLIDLKRNMTSNFVTAIGNLRASLQNSDQLLTGDVNGDGKTDIIHISDGVVFVQTVENNRLTLLFSLQDSHINPDFPALAGDYNGDGKMDLLFPTAIDSNSFALFLSTGTGYAKINSSYPFTYRESNWEGQDETLYGRHLIPTDINGDGKTDIISYNTTTYNNSTAGTQQLTPYVNSPSTSSVANPQFQARASVYHTGSLKHFPIPVFLNSEKRNRNLEFASISDDKVTSFKFNQDNREDMLMRRVVKNGATTAITYGNLSSDAVNELGYFYQYSSDESFPNQDIAIAPEIKVVGKLERNGSGIPTLQKMFTYYSAVTNFEGRGFLGFKGLGTTNWYDNTGDRIWNVATYNLDLRGAVSMEYATTSYANFHVEPTDYISKTTYQYDSELLPDKVFKLSLASSLEQNALNGTHTNRSFEYDTYGNVLEASTNFSGQGEEVVEIEYSNSTASSNYHIGRPLKKTTTSGIGGNTFSTEETYTYNGYLLSQKQTKGNNTTEFVKETYSYNNYGNLISTSVEPPGESPRVSGFEYDASQRFITKRTDPEGLETTYEYNQATGSLVKETDPFGLITQYVYDTWNRLHSVTDYLGNEVSTTYVKSGYDYTLTTTGDDGSMEVSKYNKLQQLVEEQYKDVLGQLVKRRYEYDSQGRIKRESEPFLGGSPSQWNTTEYDRYGRVIKKSAYTGKIVNISYDGLSTTVDDGTRLETTTADAMGNVLSKTEAGAGEITYSYFGNGNLKSASYDGVNITIEQDGWGRKTKLVDPSAGTYTYQYNAYGEVIKETNPKGEISYIYDTGGRLISKSMDGDQTDMLIEYDYNSQSKLLETITLTDAGGNSSEYMYDYDNFRRLILEKETTPYAEFTREYTYNSLGQVATEDSEAKSLLTASSTSKKITNTYQNGGLKSISDFGTNEVLWELEDLNARGQTLASTVGNNLEKTYTYSTMGFLTEMKTVSSQTSTPVELMRLEFDFDAQKGLLNSRHNSLFNWDETFSYDSLDRLTDFNDNNGDNSQSYDSRGRITQNSLIGTYGYSDNSYQQIFLDLNTSGQDYYDQLDYQDISFNAFKKPVQITEAGKDKLDFGYNAFEGRSNMFYGGTQSDKTQRRYQKHYAANGTMEIKTDKSTGEIAFVLYLGGDAYTAPVIWHSKQDGSASTDDNYYYLHRDYLGSILALTDADGVFKEKRHFDAWGNIVKLEDGNGNALSSFDILDRGYTGHEHLLSVGIINMNGRLYDPLLHRFLSPDNFVQDPFNTQNFNRYGYVLNNPLMYTDPSGEFIFTAAIIVGAVAGAYFGGVQANGGTWNPLKWDWNSGDTYLGLGVGAVLGGVSAVAATTVATSIAVSGASALVSTATGGMVGGMISGGGFSLMPGGDGKFFRGIAVGGLSGFAGGAIGHFASKGITNVTINGIKLDGPAVKGLVGGLAGGAGGGYVGGFTGSFLETGNLELAHQSAMKGMGMGAFIGGIMGFGTSYAVSKQQGLDPWNNNIRKWPENSGFSGDYKSFTLDSGTRIDRYGNIYGSYASPEGTPFGQRSLPSYYKKSSSLHLYEVIKPFPVMKGTVAPWFLQPGGGIQYKFHHSIEWYLQNGYLKNL